MVTPLPPHARDHWDRVEALESALEKLAETGWAAEGLSKEQLEVTQEVRPAALLAAAPKATALPFPPSYARFCWGPSFACRAVRLTPSCKYCGGNRKMPPSLADIPFSRRLRSRIECRALKAVLTEERRDMLTCRALHTLVGALLAGTSVC